MADKTIVIFHDIERGHGHRDVDPVFAAHADEIAPPALTRMLAIESQAGVRASYTVLGAIFDEVVPEVRRAGHAVGFHSFDHNVEETAANSRYQVQQCRAKEDSARGYRPPQSKITPELDRVLAEAGFEWLASSARSLGTDVPVRRDGLVRIPIVADDFDLYRRRAGFSEWEERVLTAVDEREFAAVGLHDCYAEFWLDNYRGFLDRISAKGTLRTFDEVADQL
jgi:hypothetical protein